MDPLSQFFGVALLALAVGGAWYLRAKRASRRVSVTAFAAFLVLLWAYGGWLADTDARECERVRAEAVAYSKGFLEGLYERGSINLLANAEVRVTLDEYQRRINQVCAKLKRSSAR